jgi:hypothetical protein
MSSPSFETAIEKARVKRGIIEQLATLSRDAQRDVLADLLLALDEVAAENGRAKAPRRTRRGLGRGTRVKPGRPRGTVSMNGSKGKTETIEATLKAHPRMSIVDIAKMAYPGEEDATHKVRAILWSLKKQGRAKNVGTGLWEVVE